MSIKVTLLNWRVEFPTSKLIKHPIIQFSNVNKWKTLLINRYFYSSVRLPSFLYERISPFWLQKSTTAIRGGERSHTETLERQSNLRDEGFLKEKLMFFFPLRHLHASSKWVSYSSKWICGIYTEIECMFVLSKALTSPVVHLSSWKWELCQEYSPFFWFCTRQWKCNNRYLADGALYVHLWHWISLRSEQRACRKELWVTDYFLN